MNRYELAGWQIYVLPRCADAISQLLRTTQEKKDLVRDLIEDPKKGDSLGAGLRKVRWKRPGMGKRGGVRMIYCYQIEKTLIFLYAFPKNKQEDLTEQQLNQLKILAKSIIKDLREDKKII